MAIYFDNNASTPVDPEVIEEMLPYLEHGFGNPSSIHRVGQHARRGLDVARERVAALIGARRREVIFTSGGTESDNHAVLGTFAEARERGNHLITSAIEHQAVLGACRALEKLGARVSHVGVDREGLLDPQTVIDEITDDTVLVSVMTANNDVGTIQPVAAIARATRERGVAFHSDAVQAVGKIPIDVTELEVDLLSLSSHKLHGPKGAGALYVRRGTKIGSLLHGGQHEFGLRGGTENVSAIVGFGKACELARKRLDEDVRYIGSLRDRLETGIMSHVEGAHLNGHPTKRLPGTVNISFGALNGEALLLSLDLRGVSVSGGSACGSGSHEPTHVLTAMGCPEDLGRNAVRFSVSRNNTPEEVDQVLDILVDEITRLRASLGTNG